MEVHLKNLSYSINFSEQLIRKLEQKSDLKLEEKIVITLYHQLLEQIDASFILMDHNSENPAKIMLRAAYETYISICYILKDPTLLQQRAFSYYISFIKDQLKKVEENGTAEELSDTIQECSEILNSDIFVEVLAEWECKKGNSEYNPKWHSLFNGPRNIKKLVEDIVDDNPDIYKYYGILSQDAHGYQALNASNYIDFITEPLIIKPIRKEIMEDDNIEIARAFCVGGTTLLISRMFPEFRDDLGLLLTEIGLI